MKTLRSHDIESPRNEVLIQFSFLPRLEHVEAMRVRAIDAINAVHVVDTIDGVVGVLGNRAEDGGSSTLAVSRASFNKFRLGDSCGWSVGGGLSGVEL